MGALRFPQPPSLNPNHGRTEDRRFAAGEKLSYANVCCVRGCVRKLPVANSCSAISQVSNHKRTEQKCETATDAGRLCGRSLIRCSINHKHAISAARIHQEAGRRGGRRGKYETRNRGGGGLCVGVGVWGQYQRTQRHLQPTGSGWCTQSGRPPWRSSPPRCRTTTRPSRSCR